MLPGRAHAQAKIKSVSFTQYDRYNIENKLLFQRSSLGSFTFSAMHDKQTTYYLNMFAKTNSGGEAWMVQNLPLSANTTEEKDPCESVNVDYKLVGVMPGTEVSKITYAVSLSKEPLQGGSTTTSSSHSLPMAQRLEVNQFSGANAVFTASLNLSYTAVPVNVQDLISTASDLYNEKNDLALFANRLAIVDSPRKDRDIPGLDEEPKDCVPSAFARSIAWLSKKYNFRTSTAAAADSGRKPKDIYDTLRRRMNDSCNYNFGCQVRVKNNYLKQITNGKGKTTVIPPSVKKPIDVMKDNPNCDIELGTAPVPATPDQPGQPGHMITVVGIDCDSSGCCTIRYRDDNRAGREGGDECVKTTIICGDSITLEGVKRKVIVSVTECLPQSRPAGGRIDAADAADAADNIVLLPNVPNPFDNTTMLRIQVKEPGNYGPALLIIRTERGIELQRIKVNLRQGLNEIRYQPGNKVKGVLYCTLEAEGRVIGSQKMFVQ